MLDPSPLRMTHFILRSYSSDMKRRLLWGAIQRKGRQGQCRLFPETVPLRSL